MPNEQPLQPPPVPVDEDWLSIEQISRLFGYSRNTLYVQRARGLPPASLAVLWKGRLWWRARDIDRYLNEELVANPDARWSKRHVRNGGQIKTHARQLLDAQKKAEREAARDVG